MKNTTDKLKEIKSAVSNTSASVAYDYFAICHSFVNQIKMFNDLRKFREINQANFS